MLTLYLFGPPRLKLDENPVHIPRRKAMALLAYLAVTGHSHSRDALATLLWPENDQSSARAELRRTLSVLNRTLGKGWLVPDRESAGLDFDFEPDTGAKLWLDVNTFQEKVRACENHDHPLNVTCADGLSALEEAVQLYSDDFMAGFSLKDCREYDDWQFFMQEELRNQLAKALERLSWFYESSGDFEAAIQSARRWLSLDSLQEAAHRLLMTLYNQSGQRSAALRQYKTCLELLADELGAEPSEETNELHQKIKTRILISNRDLRPKSNLPVQTTPFIGRETELAEIRAQLKQDDCRLLTLLGPGGSGKTWLAIETAARSLAEFENGAYFVSLAPLQSIDEIPSTIAGALSFSFFEEGTPEEQLLDYLRNKEILLILDNFEHLLAGVGFVNKVMNTAPTIRILATSRTSLSVLGEHIYQVMGMSYPEIPESVEATSKKYSALRLFVSTAKRRKPTFELSDENISAVIRICQFVDGMPLGIVLAASWVMILTPAEIAKEIEQNLTFLEVDMLDLPSRQRNLQSVFNHSWRMLNQVEQEIIAALSVFRGGFLREAAHIVTRASLGDLMGLIEKSFLKRSSDGRYEIHELLRQYASEKLGVKPNKEADIRDKHSEYYCQALASWEKDLEGARQSDAMKAIAVEIDNISSAWDWAIKECKIKTLLGALNSLCHFYSRRNQHLEGEKVCRSIHERLDSSKVSDFPRMDALEGRRQSKIETLKLLVRTLSWRSHFNLHLANSDLARDLVETGLNLLEETLNNRHEFRFENAMVLLRLSSAIDTESRAEAIRYAQDSLKIFKSLDKNWWVGKVLEKLEELNLSRDQRKIYFEESLKIRRRQGDRIGIADSLKFLSMELVHNLQFEDAEQLAREALSIYRSPEDRPLILGTYGLWSSLLVWQGKFNEARSFVQENLAIYDDLGSPLKLLNAHVVAGFPDLYLGAYEDARNQAQYGLALCRKIQHRQAIYGSVYVIDILGKVALAKGSFAEAEGYFQEILPLCQSFGWMENEGQVLACLGYVTRGMNQNSQTQRHFYEALRIAVEEEGFLALIHTLPGIALLFADQGDIERAVELYALASTLGVVANSKWFADIAGDAIDVVALGLPTEVIEAARARGQGLDLWATAAALQVELEEAGWGSEVNEDRKLNDSI
jgi:predicted ATPase